MESHPFFAGLDWDKVARKEYKMEYEPHIASDDDVSNFGPEFTRLSVTQSSTSTIPAISSASWQNSQPSTDLSTSSTDSITRFSGFSFIMMTESSYLIEMASSLRRGVIIKDRRMNLRSYKHCFVGSDAVSWFVEKAYVHSREEAVELGRNLLCAGLVTAVSPGDLFEDNMKLYRFHEDEEIETPEAETRSYCVKSNDGFKPLVDRLTGRPTSVPTKSIRSLLLRKKDFCPIESLLTVAPSNSFGFTNGSSFYFPPHTVHNSIALTVPIMEQMKQAFSCNNMRARENAVYALRKQVLKAADTTDKNWMYIKKVEGHHGNDVRVFYRDAVGGFQTFLTCGAIHVPPETFVEHFLDHEERQKMEAFYEAGQTVEDLLMSHTREMKVKHPIHKPFWNANTPWTADQRHTSITGDMADVIAPVVVPAEKYPQKNDLPATVDAPKNKLIGGSVQRILYRTMSSVSRVVNKRDFVTFQDSFSMKNGGHVVYEISVQHRDIPSTLPNYTRGEVLCLAHIAEPIPNMPNACMLTVVTQVGFKGKMPGFVSQMIFDKLIMRSFESEMCKKFVDQTSVVDSAFSNVPYVVEEDEEPLENRTSLLDFEILAVLGRGGFGKVMQVRHRKTRKVHAMKILKKENLVHDIQIERTRTERSILAAVEHPFIVGLSYAFQTSKKLFMVMDFVQGGDMYAHLRKFGAMSEQRARLYIAEIALAISHLHALDIVYRDLKPENILLDADGHIKITDFGLSHFLDPPEYDEERDEQSTHNCDRSNSLCQVTHSFCGTESYMAPEMLLHLGHGKPIDWWCLGIVACEMMTGIHPFHAETQMRQLFNVVNTDPVLPETLSPEATSLIYGLLVKQPKYRLGSYGGKFESIKSHPFFAGLDWDKVARKEYNMEYKPIIVSDDDVSNFLDQQEPVTSVTTTASFNYSKGSSRTSTWEIGTSTDNSSNFSGFSYVGTTAFNEAGF
ncbi:hypothetical protein THRCLA_05554 [Thraustotheca clavata]|uniref:Uncharacterized protein n=1 Tax=Thraustotheca clavata TaxID=74557 RepID=A0A1V9ZVJ2_9STRA|nr:hypothetical protein THRCLA_05554 [Thraustotheca clavata]